MAELVLTHTNKRPGSKPQPLPERHVLARVIDPMAFEGMIWSEGRPIEQAVYLPEGDVDSFWLATLGGRRNTALALADRILELGWSRGDH